MKTKTLLTWGFVNNKAYPQNDRTIYFVDQNVYDCLDLFEKPEHQPVRRPKPDFYVSVTYQSSTYENPKPRKSYTALIKRKGLDPETTKLLKQFAYGEEITGFKYNNVSICLDDNDKVLNVTFSPSEIIASRWGFWTSEAITKHNDNIMDQSDIILEGKLD